MQYAGRLHHVSWGVCSRFYSPSFPHLQNWPSKNVPDLMAIRVRSSLSHGSRREPFCFTSTPHNFVPRNLNIEQYFHLYIPALSGARSIVVLRVHFCSKRAKILSGVLFGLLPVRRNSARRPPTKHQLECGWLRDQIHGIQRQVRSTHKTTRV